MTRETKNVKPAPHVSRFTLYDYLVALAAATLVLALYLRTLAPGLLGGDSGEFQFAAWLGGFVHPTGYPLYLMLGWLWTHLLPFGDPAWRMNLLSALAGGAAVGLVYLLAVRVLAGAKVALRTLALFAAFTFAVTPTFWSQTVVAEVYALNAVFVVATLLGLATWAETRDRRLLYITAAVFGLSLAHHRTTLLYLPAIMVFLWLAARKPLVSLSEPTAQRITHHASRITHHAPRITLSTGLLLSLCLLTPLLLYAYIPARAPRAPYYQLTLGPGQMLQLYAPTLRGFVEHISGQGFGSALGAGRLTLAGLRATVELFGRELTIPGLILGLLGVIRLTRRNLSILILTGLSFLAIVAFNLFYGIGDIYVFYIPAYLIWALWMAAGVWACGGAGVWVYRRVADNANRPVTHHASLRSIPVGRITPPLVYLFPCLLAFALPAYLSLARFPQIDRSHDNTARTTWEAILAQPIPQGAILVTNDRDEMMPQWYLRYVEARRPDLTGLFPLIQPAPAWADVGAVTEQALRTGRPVYWIKPMPGMEVKFASEPTPDQPTGPGASLVRVLGPAASHPPERPAAAIYGDAIRLAGYDLSPATLAAGDAAQITLHWQPLKRLATDYTTFVHLVDADGVKLAQSDHRPGGVFYPTSLWQPGETLADRHTLALPTTLGRPPYTIVVGLYDNAAGMRHLGEPQQVGSW